MIVNGSSVHSLSSHFHPMKKADIMQPWACLSKQVQWVWCTWQFNLLIGSDIQCTQCIHVHIVYNRKERLSLQNFPTHIIERMEMHMQQLKACWHPQQQK